MRRTLANMERATPATKLQQIDCDYLHDVANVEQPTPTPTSAIMKIALLAAAVLAAAFAAFVGCGDDGPAATQCGCSLSTNAGFAKQTQPWMMWWSLLPFVLAASAVKGGAWRGVAVLVATAAQLPGVGAHTAVRVSPVSTAALRFVSPPEIIQLRPGPGEVVGGVLQWAAGQMTRAGVNTTTLIALAGGAAFIALCGVLLTLIALKLQRRSMHFDKVPVTADITSSCVGAAFHPSLGDEKEAHWRGTA